MMFDLAVTTSQLAAGGTAVAVLAAILLFQSPTSGWVRWVQRKNYQYEVTSSLYMLTPTEKFIFNSILFLTLSLLTLACVVYLPDHVVTISNRAYYYFAGEAAFAQSGTAETTISQIKAVAGNTAITSALGESDAIKSVLKA